MLFHILKNDLKRKKTMNMILFLFIVLATTFMSSGLNNVVTVMNGTDYYLDKAGVGDFVIVTMGDNSVGCLDEMLETEEAVKAYRMETVVYGSPDTVTAEDGTKLKGQNTTTIFQSIDASVINFFDNKNEKLTTVEEGHVYVSGKYMEENNLQEGDKICIKHGNTELTLVMDGHVKDALFGVEFMGNTRFILNDNDMQTLLADEEIYEHYRGQICYIDTDDVRAMSSAMSDVSNVVFSGARSQFKMIYAVEMIIVFIMLILSICLIIVSFVVLKFSITVTITEEFREIGVMKAIGVSNGKIRRLYLVKYLLMSGVGALLGLFASIPFGKLLLNEVSSNMVLGNDSGVLINILGAVLVVFVIVLFAYMCTGKVKKASPVDAIRSGQTGERYKSKSVLRIHKCPAGNAFFMALNDILSSPRRFISIMISFGICTLFVLMLVNTTSTMKSPNLISTFGTETDLYVTDVEDIMVYMNTGSKEDMTEHLEDMAEELEDEGMPAELCVEMMYSYSVTFEGNDYMFRCQQGINIQMSDYTFTEGVMPQNQYEIAITPLISEATGAKIGDTMTIHYGDEDVDCIVTAYFETMNNMGNIIRLHETAPVDFGHVSGGLAYQIDFTDNPSEKEIELRKERIKELYNNDNVMNATEFCIDTIGVVGTLEGAQFLLLGITLIVVILVTVLMERSFIADEKSQIAILKAVGFKDKAVIKWQVYRLGLVALISVIFAGILSIPMTKLCITPVFGIMGATSIDYNIEPLQVFILYPGIVLMMTVAVTWLTALYTKTIKSRDTANIE